MRRGRGRRAGSRACCVRSHPYIGDVASAPCLALQTTNSPGEGSFGEIFYVFPSTTVHVGTRFAQVGAQGPPASCIAFSLLSSKFGDGSLSLWASQVALVGKNQLPVQET